MKIANQLKWIALGVPTTTLSMDFGERNCCHFSIHGPDERATYLSNQQSSLSSAPSISCPRSMTFLGHLGKHLGDVLSYAQDCRWLRKHKSVLPENGKCCTKPAKDQMKSDMFSLQKVLKSVLKFGGQNEASGSTG